MRKQIAAALAAAVALALAGPLVIPSEGLVVVRLGFTPEAPASDLVVQLAADAIAALD